MNISGEVITIKVHVLKEILVGHSSIFKWMISTECALRLPITFVDKLIIFHYHYHHHHPLSFSSLVNCSWWQRNIAEQYVLFPHLYLQYWFFIFNVDFFKSSSSSLPVGIEERLALQGYSIGEHCKQKLVLDFRHIFNQKWQKVMSPRWSNPCCIKEVS